jgi:hypothetical protein
LLLVLLVAFPALLLEVLLVEFFLFLRLVVGCLVGSAAVWRRRGISFRAKASRQRLPYCPSMKLAFVN